MKKEEHIRTLSAVNTLQTAPEKELLGTCAGTIPPFNYVQILHKSQIHEFFIERTPPSSHAAADLVASLTPGKGGALGAVTTLQNNLHFIDPATRILRFI